MRARVGRRDFLHAGELHDLVIDAVGDGRAGVRRGGRRRCDRATACPSSRATFVQQRRPAPAPNGRSSTASASARPRVSMKACRRCSRWPRACTSHARRRSAALTRSAVERTLARDDHVVGDDGAQLERKHVERSRELVRGQQERRGQPGIVPLGAGAPRRRAGRRASANRRSPACGRARASSPWPWLRGRRRRRSRDVGTARAWNAVHDDAIGRGRRTRRAGRLSSVSRRAGDRDLGHMSIM